MDDNSKNLLNRRLQSERQTIEVARTAARAQIDTLKGQITTLEGQISDHDRHEQEFIAL